jgi:glyoxylase-like metal-dependent hydrolase (beta-lactamase superfamily II)
MERFICVTCGTEYTPSESAPAECPICLDERQYVGRGGQRWTTRKAMEAEGHRNVIEALEPNLTAIRTEPEFAIGERALLVQTPHGNVLWDCITYLDDQTVAAVRALGGIKAIAISHPHFYSGMAEWAERFDASIYLPATDSQWVMGDRSRIRFWEGEQFELLPGVTVHRVGGHFPGSSVLLWEGGAGGRGVLLTGDTVTVGQDKAQLSFMYSYPNLIPLAAREVARIRDRLAVLPFDRLYGGWTEKAVAEGARAKLERSANRYIAALS